MPDMTWMTGFQAGANLALNAERMRQQREESRLQAAQLMQQIQASRALDAYRQQEAERQRQAMMIQKAEEDRKAQLFNQEQERYNALQAWRQTVPGRMDLGTLQTGQERFLGGGQGPLAPWQEADVQPDVAGRLATEGALMFGEPSQLGSIARGTMSQEGMMERATMTDRRLRDLARENLALKQKTEARLQAEAEADRLSETHKQFDVEKQRRLAPLLDRVRKTQNAFYTYYTEADVTDQDEKAVAAYTSMKEAQLAYNRELQRGAPKPAAPAAAPGQPAAAAPAEAPAPSPFGQREVTDRSGVRWIYTGPYWDNPQQDRNPANWRKVQ